MACDLYKFEPLPEAWYKDLGTDDYNEAVEMLEHNGTFIERCLADACEVYGNNADTDEEAIENIRKDYDWGTGIYPLCEYVLDTQIDIYNQWLASFEQKGETA